MNKIRTKITLWTGKEQYYTENFKFIINSQICKIFFKNEKTDEILMNHIKEITIEPF